MATKDLTEWATRQAKMRLDQDNEFYIELKQMSRSLSDADDDTLSIVADFIRDYLENNKPVLEPSLYDDFYDDFIDAFLSEIDYTELAKVYAFDLDYHCVQDLLRKGLLQV